jgi:hypothetical protein
LEVRVGVVAHAADIVIIVVVVVVVVADAIAVLCQSRDRVADVTAASRNLVVVNILGTNGHG